jgi:hypothetical protein
MVKKTGNCLNSAELRKIAISGRDNGNIGKIAGSTLNIIPTGNWQPSYNYDTDGVSLQDLVNANKKSIKEIINQ